MLAREYVDKLRNEFIEDQKRDRERDYLIEINHVEQRDVRGYHGREILELLQNADDAYQKAVNSSNKPKCELEISISYINDVLKISNTGTFFDEDGIKAVVQGNNSPKRAGYIGNKGTGFRSILNWAKSVSIDSGDFHIIFSEHIANGVFEEIRKSRQIQKQLEKEPKLYVPMLAVPENKDDFTPDDKTTISITVNPDKTKDEYGVQKQLDEIDLRILLFLPNINKIHIQTNGKVVEYERVKDEKSPEVIVEKKVNGKSEKTESFLLFKKDIPDFVKDKDQSKDLGMVIAIPDFTENIESSYLYSFFPVLKSTSPFKCLFHATYELDDQRNNLLTNKVNYDIIKEQLTFLFSDVADYLVKRKDFKKLYEIITPISVGSTLLFQQPFSSFYSYGIETFYLNLLGKAKIFKTVCEGILSLDENPRLIEGTFPKAFYGPGFENLLDTIDCPDVVKLLKRYIDAKKLDFSYSEAELLEVINKQSENWNIYQQVETFIWWNEKKYKSLPKLLKNRNDDWLKYQDDCYFLVGSFEEDFVPSWASIPTLKLSYQKELLSQSESLPIIKNVKDTQDRQQTPRIISQQRIFPSLTFKYLDKSTVISPVNSSVTNYETAIKFVQWLWDNYNEENWHPQDEINFNFPALMKDGKAVVLSAQKIYFGSEYNKSLNESLFNVSYGKFPSPLKWNIEDERFEEFIRKFKVNVYPPIQKEEVRNPLDCYKNFYRQIVRAHGDIGASKNFTIKFIVPYIESLNSILSNLETEKIIEWIGNDKNLYAYISNPFYNDSEAEIKYQGNLQSNERKLNYQVRNYILESFNEIPWIRMNGERYSPRQILKGDYSRTNSKFSKILPTINREYITDLATKLDLKIDVVNDILNKFDFCDNPTELPSEQFYGLMLRIPTLPFNEGEDLSRSIYRIVEQVDFNKKYEDSTNYQSYKKNGKLLVKYKGVLQFYDARQCYLPSSKIVNKKEEPIIEKSLRSGNNQNFKRVFGCREYDKSYEIENLNLSKLNGDFQKYFNDFKKYAQAYSSRNKNIAEVGARLNVQLVDNIRISINGNTSLVEEECTPVRKTESIWYITYFAKELNYKKLSLAIESIYENIANTAQFDSGKIGELFRESEISGREFLIQKEFGSLDIIDDSNYALEIKNSFVSTIKKINENYNTDDLTLDFEHFDSDCSIESLICVLTELGIDVDQFQKAGFSYAVDLIPFYKKSLRLFIQAESTNFKNYLYSKVMGEMNQSSKIEDLRKCFLDEFYRFVDYSRDDIPNSISFDIKSVLNDEFGNWCCAENSLCADEAYSLNYEAMNPENKFRDEISTNQTVQTMIYFKKVDDFNSWINQKEIEKNQSEAEKKDLYKAQRDSIPVAKDIEYNPDNVFSNSTSKKRKHGAFNKKGKEKKENNQKIFGNKGELLVYNMLCQKFGKDNVFPKSEAFLDLDILKPGQADSSCGFDISYKDNGQDFFVEVKTGDSQSFVVSPEELEFANNHADQYKLFYVYDLENDPPSYHELPCRFWNDKRYKKNEIIEKIEFKF